MGNDGAFLPKDGNNHKKYWETVKETLEFLTRKGVVGSQEQNSILEAAKHRITPKQELETISSGELIRRYEEASKNPVEHEGLYTGLSTLDRSLLGVQPKNFMVICARTGVGKCERKGTEVLMADGTIKKIEDIQVGEYVQGADGPRLVQARHNGFGTCYKITPKKGDPFYVSDSHIMTCMVYKPIYSHHKVVGWDHVLEDILIEDLMKKKKHPDGTFTYYKLYRPSVEYPTKNLQLDPYIFGALLGDSTSNGDDKHIPLEYLTGDTKQRMELLAGVLDADGHLTHGTFNIVQKNKTLAKQIAQLARGLGFGVTARDKVVDGATCSRLVISGDISKIPSRVERKKAVPRTCCKNPLVTGFKIEQVEDAEYYGIQIDGDHRFLLADNTITHNTLVANYMIAKFAEQGEKILYLALEENEQEVGDRWAKIVRNNGFNVPDDAVQFSYSEMVATIKESKYNLIPLVSLYAQLGYTMICVDMLNNLLDTVRDEDSNVFLNRLITATQASNMTLIMTARLRQPLSEKEKDFPSMESVYGRVDFGYTVNKCLALTQLPDEGDGYTYLRLHVLKNRRKRIGMKQVYPKIRVSNLLKIEDTGDDDIASAQLEDYDNGGIRTGWGSRNKKPSGSATGATW